MKTKDKKAFTLVELMLAVAFLGTLLLSIALLTMQLINIYTKGATMRAINSTGSSMMKDIRTSIMSSNNKPENLDTGYDDYLWRNDMANPENSTAGMFCTGSYTYVWNYQKAMMKAHRDTAGTMPDYYYLQIKTPTVAARAYGFARIKDGSCNRFEALKKGYNDTTENTIEVSNDEELHVLLDGKTSGDGTDLAIYDFSVISATRSSGLSGKGLYDISFVLGTMRGGININSASNYCEKQTSGSGGIEDQYADTEISFCAVNRFEFVVRQSGVKL